MGNTHREVIMMGALLLASLMLAHVTAFVPQEPQLTFYAKTSGTGCMIGEDACWQAVEELGFIADASSLVGQPTVDTDYYPAGCVVFFNSYGAYPYYNTKSSSSYECDEVDQCLCESGSGWTDCNGTPVSQQDLLLINDDACDDGTISSVIYDTKTQKRHDNSNNYNFNCAEYGYDGGDC